MRDPRTVFAAALAVALSATPEVEAQSGEPPTAASAPPPPPADPEAAAPPPPPEDPAAPAAPSTPAETPSVTGNIRLDVDYWGPQLAVTANHPISASLQFTHTVGWMPASSPARDGSLVGSSLTYNAGINWTRGPVTLSPQLGFSWDASGQNTQSMSLSPQLYLTIDDGKLYAEAWLWYSLNAMFAPGTPDWLYTRFLAMYRVSDRVAIGPEVEFDMPTSTSDNSDPSLNRMPVGVVTQVGIGANMTLLLFAAYDVVHGDDNDGITGRLSWWYAW